jgi:NADPH:quinone reductase-like Zn-dependent oxidoreductase
MGIPSTMTAVVLHGADDMRVQAWPVPELGPGEVLLKVEVASICGTDVKVLHRKLQGQPEGQFIMGHEYAGTVAALGPGVDEFRVGDRVAVEVHKGCERCENCIKGWYTSCLNYGNLAKGHRAKDSRPTVASPSMPSTTSTRSSACPTISPSSRPAWLPRPPHLCGPSTSWAATSPARPC